MQPNQAVDLRRTIYEQAVSEIIKRVRKDGPTWLSGLCDADTARSTIERVEKNLVAMLDEDVLVSRRWDRDKTVPSKPGVLTREDILELVLLAQIDLVGAREALEFLNTRRESFVANAADKPAMERKLEAREAHQRESIKFSLGWLADHYEALREPEGTTWLITKVHDA